MTHQPNWFTAIVLSTVLGAFCFLSDQDYRDEFGRADELQAIQQQKAAEASREFVGRVHCGPGAVHEWTGDKEITCHPKRGRPYQVVRSEPWAISQK